MSDIQSQTVDTINNFALTKKRKKRSPNKATLQTLPAKRGPKPTKEAQEKLVAKLVKESLAPLKLYFEKALKSFANKTICQYKLKQKENK